MHICTCIFTNTHTYIYSVISVFMDIYMYIYILNNAYRYLHMNWCNVFHRPHPIGFEDSICARTLPKCCARIRDILHVWQMLWCQQQETARGHSSSTRLQGSAGSTHRSFMERWKPWPANFSDSINAWQSSHGILRKKTWSSPSFTTWTCRSRRWRCGAAGDTKVRRSCCCCCRATWQIFSKPIGLFVSAVNE